MDGQTNLWTDGQAVGCECVWMYGGQTETLMEEWTDQLACGQMGRQIDRQEGKTDIWTDRHIYREKRERLTE